MVQFWSFDDSGIFIRVTSGSYSKRCTSWLGWIIEIIIGSWLNPQTIDLTALKVELLHCHLCHLHYILCESEQPPQAESSEGFWNILTTTEKQNSIDHLKSWLNGRLFLETSSDSASENPLGISIRILSWFGRTLRTDSSLVVTKILAPTLKASITSGFHTSSKMIKLFW